MSRDRHMRRQYDSGATKRKAREEQAARESEVLSKVPKLSELFFLKATLVLVTLVT